MPTLSQRVEGWSCTPRDIHHTVQLMGADDYLLKTQPLPVQLF